MSYSVEKRHRLDTFSMHCKLPKFLKNLLVSNENMLSKSMYNFNPSLSMYCGVDTSEDNIPT